ncbi:Protein kinase domain-containing protein [Durusdinium trenchii]|uniref:Protein kinase domain-containing protein n=1 Tax=Durusdinium trenchii TaxID=1381693 RepID=A0ABP0HXZ5_9DINO
MGGFGTRLRTRIYAVADTGSPFCLVARCLRKDCPSYCAEVGCFEGEGKPSGDPDSWEGYASGVVEIQWRSDGQVSFPEAEESWSMKSIGFGVQGRVIGFGGTGKAVFFGLIRDHQAGMKQSFLEQTPFRFLTIDLRVPGREVLTLDTFGTAGSSADERVRLVDPRRWGDPVKHYCALATLRIGGQVLCAEATRKVLVLVDTGTTGASMTAPLYDAYLLLARENAQRGSSWSSARQIEVVFDDSNVSFQMYVGKHPTYGLGLDLVTPINEMAWAPTSVADKPYEDVMLMGLGFLVGTRIQVDTQRDELIVTRDQKNGKRCDGASGFNRLLDAYFTGHRTQIASRRKSEVMASLTRTSLTGQWQHVNSPKHAVSAVRQQPLQYCFQTGGGVSFKEPRELKDEASEQGLRMQKYLELIEEHPEILERKVYRKRSRDLKATCVTSL